jgi:HK97 family phage portal protein
MKIFGLEVRRAKAEQKAMLPIPSHGGWVRVHEANTGYWQRNITEEHGTLLNYPTLYACIMRIATDIGKLPFALKEEDANGIWNPAKNPSYDPVLRKPNGYQTAQQFREAWMLSKLIQGNTYALKRRDARGVVIALYILDPCRVLPMVSDGGQVFYKLQHDRLNTLREGLSEMDLTIPASEIIHDRCITLHHWLIGVPPVCAAYWPALKNLKILKSAAEFFGNNAQPGGILTAPAGMSDDDATRIKAYWDASNADGNSGKVAVIGADMKFTSFAMKGADSQLVEQMRYSDEQICQPFGLPPVKVGIGSIPAGLGVDAINQLYYADALQSHIEAIENLLDEGLRIPPNLGLWMDLEPLLRMDVGKQAEVVTKLISGKALTPDEGRKKLGYGPTGGGDTIWGQHQDYPLGMLAKRQDLDPIEPPKEPAEPDDAQIEEQARMFAALTHLELANAHNG